MSGQHASLEAYRLSSQQCGVHVPQWQSEPPVISMLAEGPGDVTLSAALQRGLDRLIARHEILRTTYATVPGLRYPMQCVNPKLAAAWSMLDAHADDAALLHAARSVIDARVGPVISVALQQGEGRLKWAIAAASHCLDALSLQQLAASYLDSVTDAAEVLQYPDYVAWQQELLAGELGQEGGRFWRAQAAQAATLRLPFEVIGTGARGPSETTRLSDTAVREVVAMAQRLELPTESVMASLWAGFIGRIGQADSLAFDWLHSDRADELTGAIGCFDARLPVTVKLDLGQAADALVRSVTGQLKDAASWHECFDAAVFDESLALAGKARHVLSFAHIKTLSLPAAWQIRHIETDAGVARLHCECTEIGGQWTLRWCATDAHTAPMLRAWMRQFSVLLEGLGEQPQIPWNRRPLLDPIERQQILASAGQPCHGTRTSTLHQLFEMQVQRDPGAVALVCGEEALSYGELDDRAERLARRLRALGVGPEQRVGVYLGRSVKAIVAMLATMKSGAAYVPLDPAYPPERIALMIEDAQMAAVIVDTDGIAALTAQGVRLVSIDTDHEATQVDATRAIVAPANLAYLIYTSGSTGRPKGVMVSHANAVASTVARFSFYPERVKRFLLLSSFSFDSSVAGIFWTLGQGGTLCLPTEDAHLDPSRIAALVAQHRISHLLALPSFYKQIAENLADASSLRCAIVAGEACHADVVERHHQRVPHAALVNEYGPTEGTVWSNAYRIEAAPVAGERIPIGRAIPSMRSLVLDETLEPCPAGVPGELYIGGDGITRGYRDRPSLTAQRFVADPFVPGARLYRTADLARRRPDGEIEYLGRMDNQIKLRGHRIELGEIEAALLANTAVREAVALVRDDVDTGQRLIACVRSDSVDAAALRGTLEAQLRARLPAFMVPAQLIVMPRLPTMPNGKLDRQTLLGMVDLRERPAYAAPRSHVERTLAEIWQSLLKVEQLGLDDDFFELGGHSLLATQVTSRIRQRLSADVPLSELFEVTTLRALAVKVESCMAASKDEIALMDDLLADAEGPR